MKRAPLYRNSRAWKVFVWVAALTLGACDNDVNFNPVAPRFPTFPNTTTAGEGRSLEILGSLTAVQGACLEATILFDGEELDGGSTRCPDASGCAELDLRAEVVTGGGHHTISFQVVSQSTEAVDYVADGRVLVSRDGLSLVHSIDLEPTHATLRPGESVSFEVDLLNFEN